MYTAHNCQATLYNSSIIYYSVPSLHWYSAILSMDQDGRYSAAAGWISQSSTCNASFPPIVTTPFIAMYLGVLNVQSHITYSPSRRCCLTGSSKLNGAFRRLHLAASINFTPEDLPQQQQREIRTSLRLLNGIMILSKRPGRSRVLASREVDHD